MAQLRQSGADRLASGRSDFQYGGGGDGGRPEQVSARIPHRQGGNRIRRPGHKGGGCCRLSVFAVAVTLALALLVSLSVFYYLFRDREVQGSLDDAREQDNETKREGEYGVRPRLNRSMAFKKLRFGKGSVMLGRDSRYWDRDDRRRDDDYDEDSSEHTSSGGGGSNDDRMPEDGGTRKVAEELASNNDRAVEPGQNEGRSKGLYNEAGRTELKEYEEKYIESLKKPEHSGEEGTRVKEVNSNDEFDDGFDAEDFGMDDFDDLEHGNGGHLHEVADLNIDGESSRIVSSRAEPKGASRVKIRGTNAISMKSGGDAKTRDGNINGELAKASSSGKKKAGSKGNLKHHRNSGLG